MCEINVSEELLSLTKFSTQQRSIRSNLVSLSRAIFNGHIDVKYEETALQRTMYPRCTNTLYTPEHVTICVCRLYHVPA